MSALAQLSAGTLITKVTVASAPKRLKTVFAVAIGGHEWS
jgi:hypothetical protein